MALRFGISAALTTPFTRDGAVDGARVAAHAQRCRERGCTSVTVFGTTGEGPSVAAAERDRTAAELVAGGLPAAALVEGVIACSVAEAVHATARALARGSRAVLLAPPFYFRGAGDDGLFAWYAEVFRGVGPRLRDILLYHIPSMTGAALSPDLVGRLRRAFPDAILGVKDSGCDAAATLALLEAHRDLVILVGDETYLGRACAAGAAGSICGLANLVPEAVIRAAEDGRDDQGIAELVRALAPLGFVPMLKALLAAEQGDPDWAIVRPPLTAAAPAAAEAIRVLVDRLHAPAGTPA
jgi:4-hydroxy-tetrahydrodipicolinate synthase